MRIKQPVQQKDVQTRWLEVPLHVVSAETLPERSVIWEQPGVADVEPFPWT
jgi:hypothetical protein